MNDTNSSFPIDFNQSNYTSGSNYTYSLGNSIDTGEYSIALKTCSLAFSWPNITAAYNNNKFTISHPTDGANVSLTFTIDNGGYNIDDLNDFLAFSLIKAGYYIQNNATGEQTVYASFEVNAATYKIAFISYPVPTELPAGYTAGSAITFPAVSVGPQLIVSGGFATLIGFAAGTFPAAAPTVITTTESTLIPIVNPRSQVVIQLDSIWNPIASNSKILHSFSIAGVPYAGRTQSEPKELSFVRMQAGYHSQLTLTFTDIYGQPLNIIDTDISVELVLKRII